MDEARWSTDILSGDQATEENLISLLNQSTPNILHVATHGFSFESPHDEPLDLTLQERFNYRYSADPMERSGIILAGGNWKWIGNDTLHIMQKRDGILNAKETSTLNLKGCQLAVLSACQTALGDVDDTEGTFGIVRGFKLAGVDQLIVSLWKVPDEQTSEFMQEFYKVLVQNKDIPSSFRIAQNTMREKYPTNPRLWAAFVLVQ
jgi:CHAT domain-containing protein